MREQICHHSTLCYQNDFGLCEVQIIILDQLKILFIENFQLPKDGRSHHSVDPRAEIEIHRKLAEKKARRFVKIFDDFKEDGTVYIVMEYCEEGSLKDFLNKDRSPMGILLGNDVFFLFFFKA